MHVRDIALYAAISAAQGIVLAWFYHTHRVKDSLRQSESIYISVLRSIDDHNIFVACFLSPVIETRFFFRHNEVQFFTAKSHRDLGWFINKKFEEFQNITVSEVYVPGDDMLVAIRISDIIIHICAVISDDDIEYTLVFKSHNDSRIVMRISVGHRMALMKIIVQIAGSITRALANVDSGHVTGNAGDSVGVGGVGGA